jgi:hypothetical protein
MNEQECLSKMIAPGQLRPSKWLGGVIQICLTRMCDLSCYGCTQASNTRVKKSFMTPEQFEQAVISLRGYTGVVGIFGGNPALSPHFEEICNILATHIPFRQRGLWCNNPLGKGKIMRKTFNPQFSNLNVHLSQEAYDEFKRDWPECHPCGLHEDSRHSPPYVAMKDVILKECSCQELKRADPHNFEGACATCGDYGFVTDDEKIWELISTCDINQYWSAYIGLFRGELRAYFCEVAGAQASMHEDDPAYPDTGVIIEEGGKSGYKFVTSIPWWKQPMEYFRNQVRHHCFSCGIPLRGRGELAQSSHPNSQEQVSATHVDVYRPKRTDRRVEVVTELQQLGTERLENVVKYIQNSKK